MLRSANYNRSARIRSSGQIVPIWLEDGQFWVWHFNAKRCALEAAGFTPASGTFQEDDERFEILPEDQKEAWRARNDS